MPISLEEFTKFLDANKGKRKFKQTVEVAINFKDIDFSKQDNRLNLEVRLPNGKGKIRKVAIFSNDKSVSEAASKLGVEVIDSSQLEAISKDAKRQNSLLNYDLLAQANMMPQVARYLGQFLGPRNRMPKPVMPNMKIDDVVKGTESTVTIRSKGKYLPTVHSIVGIEDMEPSKIYNNIIEVVNGVGAKVGQNNVKSVYVKLTMSEAVKFS
jgi:large subunit ribosomal protein L1